MNPLLEKSTHAHEAIPYDLIKAEHFLPALNIAIKEAVSVYEGIKNSEEASFINVIEAGEVANEKVDYKILLQYEGKYRLP